MAAGGLFFKASHEGHKLRALKNVEIPAHCRAREIEIQRGSYYECTHTDPGLLAWKWEGINNLE